MYMCSSSSRSLFQLSEGFIKLQAMELEDLKPTHLNQQCMFLNLFQLKQTSLYLIST